MMKNHPVAHSCQQNLSASRKRFLKKKFEDDTQFLKHRFNRLSDLIKKIKTFLIEQHSALEHAKKDEQHAQLVLIKIDEISKTVAKHQKLIKSISSALLLNIRSCIPFFNQLFSQNKNLWKNFCIRAKKSLRHRLIIKKYKRLWLKLKKKLAAHSYNPKDHEKATQAFAQIENSSCTIRIYKNSSFFKRNAWNRLAISASNSKSSKNK